MVGIYDNNPLEELYKSLNFAIKYNTINDKFSKIDSIMKLILENNGCSFVNNNDNILCYKDLIMNNSYALYFIIGGTGNDVNQCFDFIEFNGMKYLVIFLDHFADIKEENTDEDIVIKNIDAFMGKSTYFEKIVKIVQIFIATITTHAIYTPALSTSAAANVYRYAPSIIAGAIILNICGELNENDVSGIDYKSLMNFMKEPIKATLYGIYVV